MTQLTHLPADCGTADIIEAVEREGAVIVEDFVSAEWLQQFNTDVQTSVDAYEPYNYGEPEALEFLGFKTVRLNGILSKAPAYLDLMLDERLLGVMDHFLGPNCGQYQLNSSELVEIHGGETAQELHTDDMIWPVNYWAPDRLLQFNVMVAGTNFTKENGATQIVPGSHKWMAPERVPQQDEICQAVMSAGSAVFIPGKTLHGGGASTTDNARRAIVTSYVLGWLKTQENHQFHNTLEQVAKLPKRAQQLLGYDLYAHYDENITGGPLGYYEYRSPAVLLE